jgi:murein L,D-transpeptidase YafK
MVHVKNVSIGCFAMTDPIIEEIYLIVDAALSAGQSTVPVHCFPFRMTAKRLAKEKDSPWHDFWQKLKQGWDAFEQTKTPPQIKL